MQCSGRVLLLRPPGLSIIKNFRWVQQVEANRSPSSIIDEMWDHVTSVVVYPLRGFVRVSLDSSSSLSAEIYAAAAVWRQINGLKAMGFDRLVASSETRLAGMRRCF